MKKNTPASEKPAQLELVDEFSKQLDYIQRQKARGRAHLGLLFADAFIRGMRDLGYKSPATALDELADNSIQANATEIEFIFGFANPKKPSEPDKIAVVDDGHGMVAEMIRFAVMWGGTHREGDRKGFGRYGYGLPSAAVGIAKRYTVYSKPKDQDWHAVTIDLTELAERAGKGEELEVPKFRKESPPSWIDATTKKVKVAKISHGTVIVLEQLDRLPPGWVQTPALQKKLLSHFGVTYRHWIPQPRIFVHGEEVQPVDPLFLMENGRFFDETNIMANAAELKPFEVETAEGNKGMVRFRASWLPANFQATDPSESPQEAKTNSRFPIMKEYNGLLICRAGRQIDCIRQDPWVTWVNYDRNVKIEIDFDPALDEFFGITTSKQQVTVKEGMWARLEAAGLRKLIKDLRKQFKESNERLEAKLHSGRGQNGDAMRASEQAMAESVNLMPTQTRPSPGKVEKAKKQLQTEAANEAEKTGKPLEETVKETERKTEAKPFKIDFSAIPEGPFYRPVRIGKQKRLIINTAHRFYTDVYASPDASPTTKAALEVLLLVLGEGELDAEGEFERWYGTARKNWSMRLDAALMKLDPNSTIADKASALAEAWEAEVEEKPEPVNATETESTRASQDRSPEVVAAK